MSTHSFGKEQKLKSRKVIAGLFNEGNNVFSFPIKALYGLNEEDKDIKIAVTASKRSFKNAVDRNLIKRRVREAYRLNNANLLPGGLSIMFIYVGKAIEDYDAIETGMKKVLKKISQNLKDTK